VAIARANNLASPDVIHSGNVLILPKADETIAKNTMALASSSVTNDPPQQQVTSTDKITGTSYTVEKGDNLWSIAVRAYGDGYKWVKIANENKFTNPGVIHSGNSLQIPR